MTWLKSFLLLLLLTYLAAVLTQMYLHRITNPLLKIGPTTQCLLEVLLQIPASLTKTKDEEYGPERIGTIYNHEFVDKFSRDECKKRIGLWRLPTALWCQSASSWLVKIYTDWEDADFVPCQNLLHNNHWVCYQCPTIILLLGAHTPRGAGMNILLYEVPLSCDDWIVNKLMVDWLCPQSIWSLTSVLLFWCEALQEFNRQFVGPRQKRV